MATTVNHPTLGTIEFPSEMGDADIVAAIKKLEAQAPAAAPTAASGQSAPSFFERMGQMGDVETGIPPFSFGSQLSPETRRAIIANTVRYGIPIAAGIATAPEGGVGFLPAMAMTSGIGAATSIPSEAVASTIEGSPITLKKLESAGILGATPFLPPGAASLPVRMLANPAITAATSIGAAKVRGEKITSDTWMLPVLLSSGFTSIGGIGKAVDALGKVREYLSKSRFGGSVAVQELLPELGPLENQAYQAGSATARRTINQLDANFADGIKNAFADVPDIGQKITDELGPQIGRVQGLKMQSDAAAKAEAAAKEAADAAMAQGSREYPLLREKAKQAGLVALRDSVVANQGARQLFPPTLSQSIDEVKTGAQQAMLKKIDDGIKEARKSGLGALYDEANIGLNDPVIDLPTVLNLIVERAKNPKDLLHGKDLREKTIGLITNAFGENQLLTREGLMNLADNIAESLVAKNKDAGRAEKAAADIYAIVKEASGKFIQTNRPEVGNAYIKANEAAAAFFKARGTDLTNAIVTQRPAAIVDRIISEGGKGKAVQEINDYVNAIQLLGPEFAPVSNEFRQGVSNVLRAGILEKANAGREGTGWNDVLKVYNLKNVVKQAQALADSGFPVESLGFGNADELKELARVSSAFTEGGMTAQEFDAYRRLSPAVGANAAAARIAFRKAARDSFIAPGGLQQKITQENKLKSLARQAKMNTDQVNAELAAAQKDPVAQLLYDTSLNLSKDPVKNVDYVRTVLDMEPSTVKRLVGALESSGRTPLLEQVKFAAKSQVMKDLIEGNLTDISSRNLRDMFYGVTPQSVRQRQAFETLIGATEYANLKKNFVVPIASAIDVQKKAAGALPLNMDVLAGVMATYGASQGKTTSGIIKAMALIRTIKGANTVSYNIANKLFVDPNTAPKFAALGYSMDKIMQQPELVATLKLAQAKDSEAQAERQKSPQ